MCWHGLPVRQPRGTDQLIMLDKQRIKLFAAAGVLAYLSRRANTWRGLTDATAPHGVDTAEIA
jgi:hypothetical protein